MRTVILAVDHQLRHNDRIVRRPAQRADPPLGGSQVRRMDREGPILRIPRRRCLQAPHVRPVAELRLRVAANDLVVFRLVEEKLVLLGSALVPQRDQEHRRVESIWTWLANKAVGGLELFLVELVFDGELA